MTQGMPVLARVVSFDPAGFIDHDAGFARYPVAVLHVAGPSRGTDLTLVLDLDLDGVALLQEPGRWVRLLLDPEAQGLDPVFAGALVDGTVHAASAPATPLLPDVGGE
jgi:hypothetical protein